MVRPLKVLAPLGDDPKALALLLLPLAAARPLLVTLFHVGKGGKIHEAERIFRGMGMEAEGREGKGEPATEIAAFARTGRFDLLAMISHGRRGLKRVFLGSVAEQVLRHTKTPLLLAHAKISPGPWHLIAAAVDGSPESERVLATAARSLEPLASLQIPNVRAALNRLLEDPVRAVRIEAAWALHSEVDPRSTAGADLVHYLRQNADQPSGALQFGIFHLDRNETETALNYFRRAVDWDAHSAPFHDALAMALNAQGKMDEAAKELEIACRLAPREAEYRYKFALALNELGKPAEATTALEEAVKLDPQFARAWYNLGLAYSQTGQSDRALDALIRAESVDALSARIPYARATILARLGRHREARITAHRALELDPAFSDAAILLQNLEAESK